MRHPGWKLAGWLSWLGIGLTGCLHGQDWRAAVSKPMTRPVAERREFRPVPNIIGPFRRNQSPVAKTAPTKNQAISNASSVNPSKVELVPPSKSPVPAAPLLNAGPTPSETRMMQAGFDASESTPVQPQPIVSQAVAEKPQEPAPNPASSLQIDAADPANTSFAEFERSIPTSKIQTPAQSTPKPAVEVVVPETKPVVQAAPLPVITPAAASMPSKPVESHRSPAPKPDDASADSKPQQLFSKSVGRAKELPDVTDTNLTPSVESKSANAEREIRPQDVSVVVEQVFEDLRQRRISAARQRTEWLKQLVSKRASINPPNDNSGKTEPRSAEQLPDEPRHLNVDPNAAVAPKANTEAFFDEEPMSRE